MGTKRKNKWNYNITRMLYKMIIRFSYHPDMEIPVICFSMDLFGLHITLTVRHTCTSNYQKINYYLWLIAYRLYVPE